MTEHRVVVPHPIGESFTGIKRVIQSVTNNFGDDFKFDILTPEPPEEIKERFDGPVEFRTFDKKLPWWGMDYRRPGLKRILDEYDLIWNHTLMFNDIVNASNTPVVTTFHSIEHNPPKGLPLSISSVKYRLKWRMMKNGFTALSDCERTVCVSDRSRNVVERRVGASAVRIYNGADFLGSEMSEEDEGYILSADAHGAPMHIARKLGFPVKVLRPSSGMEDQDNVEVIDRWLSDEELKQMYRKCSFYISGSYSDGFGLTPIEANHFGKPSIIFEKEVASETVENGVNGFRSANMYEMVEKARMLIEDEKLRKEMGETALEFARENFTWEKAAERYREEFLSVIE